MIEVFQILCIFPSFSSDKTIFLGKAMTAEKNRRILQKYMDSDATADEENVLSRHPNRKRKDRIQSWFSRQKKERHTMKSNNSINVPEAKQAMEQFKMQAASDEGVPGTY